MVCPVYELNRRERKVYLPKGTEWIDSRSRQIYEGGQWIKVLAPLESIPIFIRKGAKIDQTFFRNEKGY